MPESSEVAISAPYQLVAARYGAMLVNVNDMFMGQSYLHYGECFQLEVDLLLPLLAFPGIVIDVGANMGVHTIPLAKELARQGRRMLSFEPQPVIFQQLCANLALNGLMNVLALPYACGSTSGVVSFAPPDYANQGNFGGIAMSAQGGISAVMTAPCHTLDEIVQEAQVTLIKIDVEGFELEVLKGAKNVLNHFHPVLYVENDRPDKSAALIQWLMDNGYRLWWHTPALYNPKNFRENAENIFANILSYNMICVHHGSNVTVEGFAEITDPALHPLNTSAHA
jgi:FkbM family methyltransferase